MTKNEASYILDFLDMIIDEVYQRNAKLKKLAVKNQEFSRAKEAKLFGKR